MEARLLVPAYVALGSNLDEPRARVEQAFDALDKLPETSGVLRSSLYRTAPFGPVTQPQFVNAVAGLLTSLGPGALLAALKELETRLGRTRPAVRWGPRHIDLDLLVYGTTRLDTEELKLPHPGIAERAFVLVPLAQIAPELEVPGVGRVRTLLSRIDASGVSRIAG
jgi:2-amino-4-hydroxy-6-hydroxymethyldihydropteridine diphosphokinase